ncbi:MAG TPA: phosphatidylserine decarboxylase [Candidatus Acidoferrales bacterium]|nr:phosphatidylserine decarboxylase [Candidatus Acidoferrales bacterium]
MKHSGKAILAALKLSALGLGAVIVLFIVAVVAHYIGGKIVEYYGALFGLWLVFTLFTLYFFRDPNPMTPTGANLVISPAHGKVDVIDTVAENEFMGGECKRISIFLSIFNVHVQNAPLTGRVAYFKHSPGQFLSATRTECAKFNENVLVGVESFEPRGEKIALRLIAGLIARRIVPWIAANDPIQRGDRISLIQFGSRVEVYLPMNAKIKVPLGQKVVGGETVLASFD